MIPAISPVLSLLAPKAAATAGIDPAAFGLTLAGVGEAVIVGRQMKAPGGNPMPLPADALLAPPNSRLLSTDDQFAETRPPIPGITITAPSPPPLESSIAAPKPTVWPRFAQPETCAGPISAFDPPIPADGREEVGSNKPARPHSSIRFTAFPAIEPSLGRGVVEPEQAAAPDPVRAPELALGSDAGGPPKSAVLGDAVEETAFARLNDDEPSPSFEPPPEPARAAVFDAPDERAVVPLPASAPPVPPSSGTEITGRPVTVTARSAPIAREPGTRPIPAFAKERASEQARGVAIETIPSATVARVVPPEQGRAPVVGRSAVPAIAPYRPLPSLSATPADQPGTVARSTPEAEAHEPAPTSRSMPPLGSISVHQPVEIRLPVSGAPTTESVSMMPRDGRPMRPSIDAVPAPPLAAALSSTTPAAALVGTYDSDVQSLAPRRVSPEQVQSAPPAPAQAPNGGVALAAQAVHAASLAPLAPAAQPLSTAVLVDQPTDAIGPPSDLRSETARPATPERATAASTPLAPMTPAPTTIRTVMSGSARQVFAADLRRSTRDLRGVAGETLALPLEAARLDAATAVAAPAAAPLDLRQDRWPAAMVERIERLRDAVDAVDTRIRLIPDALGAIDVAVKRDGDTVHVHFSAEQAATRALLQDAAPRLAEAAEARGLKLGQTGVGDGGSQQGGRQPQSQTAATPVPARPRSATAADEDSTDTRIA